jgi:hypothetical protein
MGFMVGECGLSQVPRTIDGRTEPESDRPVRSALVHTPCRTGSISFMEIPSTRPRKNSIISCRNTGIGYHLSGILETRKNQRPLSPTVSYLAAFCGGYLEIDSHFLRGVSARGVRIAANGDS